MAGDRWRIRLRRGYGVTHFAQDWPSHRRFVDESMGWDDVLMTRSSTQS